MFALDIWKFWRKKTNNRLLILVVRWDQKLRLPLKTVLAINRECIELFIVFCQNKPSSSLKEHFAINRLYLLRLLSQNRSSVNRRKESRELCREQKKNQKRGEEKRGEKLVFFSFVGVLTFELQERVLLFVLRVVLRLAQLHGIFLHDPPVFLSPMVEFCIG